MDGRFNMKIIVELHIEFDESKSRDRDEIFEFELATIERAAREILQDSTTVTAGVKEKVSV